MLLEYLISEFVLDVVKSEVTVLCNVYLYCSGRIAVKYYNINLKTVYKLSSYKSYDPVKKSFKADLETVDSFVHVGTKLLRTEDEEEVEVELPNIFMSANKVDLSLLPIIKSQVAYRNKRRIYKTLIRPALRYGAKHG